MRKLAAHYLISDTGVFLKNGMAVVGDDGFISQYTDTKGDLREVEQLIFHSGILMAGFKFTKASTTQAVSTPNKPFRSCVLQAIAESTQLSMHHLIKLGKEVQLQFPEIKIPAIMNQIEEILFEVGFLKDAMPGIFLLKGVNLVELHFTSESQLKKIL